MISKCNFSFKHYIETLNLAKGKYSIGPIKDFPKFKKKEKFIILRHDVDISLDSALNMARIEYEYGFHSSYFILFRSPYYNPLSEINISEIKEISMLGHEIGLHYDSRFSKNKTDLMKQIQLESTALEIIIDKKITSICQHGVSIGSGMNARSDSNFLDAMAPDILKLVKYISDSVQNWRSGCMCNHVGNENKLKILTHPIWWSSSHTQLDKILKHYEQQEIVKLKNQIKNSKNVQKKYPEDLKNGRIE